MGENAMHKLRSPQTVSPPFSRYSHAVEAAPGLRWLHASGQVGVDVHGKTASGFEAQARQAFANLQALLDDAGMGWGDVVKLTTFITDRAHLGPLRQVRDVALGEARPASTLLVVAGLASPDWLIEAELVAAKA
jgi:enamine deaminase RidA (YjgF/YER057c/UK114 family)